MNTRPERNDEQVVVGLFDPTIPLSPVLDQLRCEGIPDYRMTVISPFPLGNILINGPVRFPLHRITIISGLFGIGIGVCLSAGTALLYPLATGGKPIVSIPVVGIISFETMMLMAIIGTFMAMMIRIGFMQQSDLSHFPRTVEGAVGLSIHLGDETAKAQAISSLLQKAGAADVEIRTVGSHFRNGGT
ncbi:MAG: DUF3341 domain-containing protein [Nitrospira sp.]|nr:DUF3341 domain-containing protein [Nitrospira sp.]HBP89609.1 hypothetical protein [Nitrospiraceae bacterium]HNP27823.1 DUF3341 domain-containing protein [Nitrospirales bacterium]